MEGLPKGKVLIEDYKIAWREAFEKERGRLSAMIGQFALAIEHIGSTAVPGLCAKPVIDIAVGIQELKAVKECIGPLSSIGYEYRGEAGLPGRHFFVKGSMETRTQHLHVELFNGPLWRSHILFRDYLRSHPKEAAAYAKMKRALAEKYSDDRDAYTSEKNNYIEGIVKLALQKQKLLKA
jgi:GrpB-like predicted nucleotidyltransferase (UPF0157 family)